LIDEVSIEDSQSQSRWEKRARKKVARKQHENNFVDEFVRNLPVVKVRTRVACSVLSWHSKKKIAKIIDNKRKKLKIV